ncbi:hypothetical protein A3C57_00660 [Candidatus Nomurabacteria bacterium RIFCSPHIGHO2_02_FULL_33_12]|nr:MAG: hypothetical protein A3C57_00660 [Candidatus Nomurabacteria bacterium RIFCSPHIGHO2_02_FULL_33_12]
MKPELKNYFVVCPTNCDPGATVTQNVLCRFSNQERKFILPGVRTSKDGKSMEVMAEEIPWETFKKANTGSTDLDELIYNYFPPNSGSEIKKILGVVE